MPDYTFTFQVQGISAQRATGIRDRMAQRLGDDQVSVRSVNMVRDTYSFRVIGVNVSTRETVDETVEALDADSAAAAVATADVVVAHINPLI